MSAATTTKESVIFFSYTLENTTKPDYSIDNNSNVVVMGISPDGNL